MLFYRFSYFKNLLGATFGSGYSLYDNKDITRNHVVGMDFNTGTFTHSIRFSFLKFQNQIVDATTGNSALPFDNLGAEIFMGATGLVAGPNPLAPQSTPQSDHQLKYDGSRILGFAHRCDSELHSIISKAAVLLHSSRMARRSLRQSLQDEVTAAATGPFPGGASNPLNYPADGGYVLGNGLGLFDDQGGAWVSRQADWVLTIGSCLYLGDSWKIKPNFILTYGLRYDRDTGRTDSQYRGDSAAQYV